MGLTLVQKMAFPERYVPLECLGKGGGGEVWSARDRVSDRVVAVKLLREDAEAAEMMALVREATLLSGIEGLGVPRVLHFGRLPQTDRAFMVRELVDGTSLLDLMGDGGEVVACLSAVAQAADLVTQLHRSLLLHGDIKPANIIVTPEGSATLVDLGLAAHWQEGGTTPKGLTPRYAAPELFLGDPLTPRAEVFALGATARDVLKHVGASLTQQQREAVRAVVERATDEKASARHPSADEFAEGLRRAARLAPTSTDADERIWSIVGIEQMSETLIDQISALGSGAGLVISGAEGSGRTTLVRRVSWSLGVAGIAVGFIEEGAGVDLALDALLVGREAKDVVIIVDDADQRSEAELERVDGLRKRGAKLVMVVSPATGQELPGRTFALYPVPAVDPAALAKLVTTMIPSLSDKLVGYVVARAGGLPGVLRTVVRQLGNAPLVSIEDIERRLSNVPVPAGLRIEPHEIHQLLDRGLFDHAGEYLEAYQDDESPSIGLARAKLATGRGHPMVALRELERIEQSLSDEGDDKATWYVEKARAHLRAGDYDEAEAHAELALTRLGASLLGEVAAGNRPDEGGDGAIALVAEALATSGIAQSLSARHEEAADTLQRSVEVARGAGEPRVLAVALGSLAFALQRHDRLDEAEDANHQALELAERAGDAGHVATTRLNLAGISRMRGDIAAALVHLEAAVDMGRRSGRRTTVRQALLNLANLDIYLGRLGRAQSSIDALVVERSSLGQAHQAHLLALEAEVAALAEDFATAQRKCRACADAYQRLGRSVDAAEALLERALFQMRSDDSDLSEVQEDVFLAESLLGDGSAHRPLMLIARGNVALLAHELDRANDAYDEAIAAAQQSGQREWLWRAYAARGNGQLRAGDASAHERDRKAALVVLEEIAQELPRDLREVYWHEPRRRAIKQTLGVAPSHSQSTGSIDELTQVGGEARVDRLTRVLEINRAIAGEYDLDRLLEKVTDHAIELLYAERGFVLLKSKSGQDRLSVHAARDRHGDEPHARFSRSIAERVVATDKPFVAIDAGRDERVSDYVSVHALMLKSVACVPIRARSGTIGALYVETRVRPGGMFETELPTVIAFADQVAIAIETARLVNENELRAQELEKTNTELEAARAKLEELLGRRTKQLKTTRRNLRSAREVLRGHFGYKDIVGTSVAMRRVYAIVDRVKDADVPVLITGESGTGKEVIARAIHTAGPRAKQKFVGINCGAIPEHLLESELFGHVRGAFTGADRDHKGLFRELDQGTILLDEIGEMPHRMQASLLRVLQEKVVRPVGGTKEEAVNARIIAATHRDLADMVSQGSFREDLYYRLNVIQLQVPPLRQRCEDVPLLVDHFLRIFAARYSREKRNVSRDAIKLLMGYRWPGNVRQLENVLLNAWILSDGAELERGDFELPSDGDTMGGASEVRVRATSVGVAEEQERERILEALNNCNWNRAKAAELVGIPRRTFYRRLKKYGIQ